MGEYVDMYIPRKCSASNRIIAAKDHASIQMNIVDVDETTGRMTSTFKTYAICGQISNEFCNLVLHIIVQYYALQCSTAYYSVILFYSTVLSITVKYCILQFSTEYYNTVLSLTKH